ncbi:MAG TPA: alpha/beta hydrolase-fold protein [Hanamia sp.]|nr:alpha/beta hydrolase-fold protein [Hanamia sp.]
MEIEKLSETDFLNSTFLEREVTVDFYFTGERIEEVNDMLLINDGQDLITMNFEQILKKLNDEKAVKPLLCVGIHCGPDRKNEYGTAGILNYKEQGSKAKLYACFILEELLPFISNKFSLSKSVQKSFCGFSLGGLSAFDIAWNHANEFSKIGVFSGSFWWRTVSQDAPEFVEEEHRIMHQQVRNGNYNPSLKFFFEAGELDETADRNHNGIIDSIDDTISLIDELIKKGYSVENDIFYLQLKDGKHDVSTWGRAFPVFLKWGWQKKRV